ncbi:hypothetical protein HPB48_013623 [Haemaphysalis longicornis]|uniref:Uncharacterized protein n=1 Tax=Haemaphysalis longicornis TaxID=44386 RepID=A0A9J6FAX9_HAELO|nr:hypothetical protein HPB48_013623 [Haemaphysalis longicornis]
MVVPMKNRRPFAIGTMRPCCGPRLAGLANEVANTGWLERGQREVGRLALGCHGRVAVEAIQGDLGWSTFEAREATSKIAFEERLRVMNDERWARRLFPLHGIQGVSHTVVQPPLPPPSKIRLHYKPDRGGPAAQDHGEGALQGERRGTRSLADRNAPKVYPGTVPQPQARYRRMRVYDNSSGSTLLFEARAGALRTLLYCRHYDSTPEVQQQSAGHAATTRKAWSTWCCTATSWRPPARVNATIQQALGFENGVDNAMDVHTTKERLQLWQRSVRLGAAVVTVQ